MFAVKMSSEPATSISSPALSSQPPAAEADATSNELPETLEPLTGILTLRRRKVDTNRWHCLLCKTTNGALWAYCKACHRDRYPAWLKDVSGHLVHPGLVISADDVELGMVVKVSRLPDQVTALFLQEKESRPVAEWELKEKAIPADKVCRYQVVRDKRVEIFYNFGLCGDCGRTYHIRYGYTFLHVENDRVLIRIRLSRKKADLQRLVEEKARLVKAHKKEEVFECTKRVKALKREMELLHCQLGGAATWCPYCLWRPTN